MTSFKPDLFLISESKACAIILELTCPWDSNIQRSHDFKEEKYAPLVADLSNNFRVFHFLVEVSVKGQITKQNRCRLKMFIFWCCHASRGLTKKVVQNASKVSLLASFSIFSARREPLWTGPPLLTIY